MISFIPRVLPHIPPRIRVVRICTFGEFMTPFVAVVVNVTMSRHPRSVVHGRLAGRTTFSRHLNAPSRPPILNSFSSLTDRPTAQCSASNQWHLWKRAAGEDGTSPLLSSSSEYFLSQGGGQLYFSRRIEQNLLGRV